MMPHTIRLKLTRALRTWTARLNPRPPKIDRAIEFSLDIDATQAEAAIARVTKQAEELRDLLIGVGVMGAHRHTDECLANAAQTGQAHCIAECRDARESCHPPSDGVSLIALERVRQVDAEGWTPEHDDAHAWQQLSLAAVCYAAPEPIRVLRRVEDSSELGWVDPWPFEPEWDKRGEHDRVRQLVIAGALIVAEIDRLKRAEARP